MSRRVVSIGTAPGETPGAGLDVNVREGTAALIRFS